MFIIGGVTALYFGGQWTVDGAVGLAQELQVDDALIGLTIVELPFEVVSNTDLAMVIVASAMVIVALVTSGWTQARHPG